MKLINDIWQTFGYFGNEYALSIERGSMSSWWRHNGVHLTSYLNLLLSYYRTCCFRRKTQTFSIQWESFLWRIWNLYIAKKRTELNFWIYFVQLYNFVFISVKETIKNIIEWRQDLKENLHRYLIKSNLCKNFTHLDIFCEVGVSAWMMYVLLGQRFHKESTKLNAPERLAPYMMSSKTHFLIMLSSSRNLIIVS